MKSSVQSNAKTDAQTFNHKEKKDECVLNNGKSKGNKDEMSTNNEYTSPSQNLNKKRNRKPSISRSSSSSESSSSSSSSSSQKKKESYWSNKQRERGKETNTKKKGDNTPMNKSHCYCHHCGELVLLNKTLICSMPQCDECYCFSCVKTSYISFLDKTPLAALKKMSNNNKWHCFKCSSKCLCLRCIPGSKKKTTNTQPMPLEVFIPPPSNILCKGYKTFKTELVNKEPEQESLNSNEIGCKILKIKDEALIQSLHYSKPNRNQMMMSHSGGAYDDNSNTKSRKKSKKKKKQNSKHEPSSPKTKALEDLKVQDEKIQQLVRQCEGYFYEQSKRKSFFKKTCLSCKGQCFNTNEILYFRYLKDFLSYVNYLFTYQPILIYHTEIANMNKEILHDDMKELNGAKNKEDWHFSQPKVICKGCLMVLLNKYDGIEILRSILMDNKDKKQESSDKEREIEQENEIKLQTKDINELIARDNQLKKEKKEEKQMSNANVNVNNNANVFDKVFNKIQTQPQLNNQINNQPQSDNKQIESKQSQSQLQSQQRDQISTNNSTPMYYQIPVYIPEVFPQYFQTFLNDILLYFNQLINESMALNQQYQTTIINKETIGEFYLMIEKIIKRNFNKEQEIIQIMFKCNTMLFAFMNYLHYLYSFSPTNDTTVLDSLRKTKEMLEYEYGAFNKLMNKMLQAMEFFRTLSYDYLMNIKMQYYILERLSMG